MVAGLALALWAHKLDVVDHNEREFYFRVHDFGAGSECSWILVLWVIDDEEWGIGDMVAGLPQEIPLVVVLEVTGPEAAEVDTGSGGKAAAREGVAAGLQGEEENWSVMVGDIVSDVEGEGGFTDRWSGDQVSGCSGLEAVKVTVDTPEAGLDAGHRTFVLAIFDIFVNLIDDR